MERRCMSRMLQLSSTIQRTRRSATAMATAKRQQLLLKSCTMDDLVTWYVGWKKMVSGVDLDVPSPLEVESEADL